MKAIIHNACIRGCERKTNKNGGEYILVRFEEVTGAPQSLVDKDLSREPYYVRDTIMDLYIDIDQGRSFTNIRIIDARIIDAKEETP